IAWTAWGVRPGSAIAVRGPGRDSEEQDGWKRGYLQVLEAIAPSRVLVFGLASRVVGCLDSTGVAWVQVPLRRAVSRSVCAFSSTLEVGASA
ncbi:hypothetical protein, partial [Thiorhodococcus drewsii]|uniref:hypothetical protein n=1 Tax=Thiorhodococcus drewsii TaxID=210408 RepID=UPI00059543C3